MTIETRKYKLIEQITSSNDETLITQLEQLIKQNNKINLVNSDLLELATTIEGELNIEQLMKEQNFRHTTKAELDEIISAADIQESIEELLEMI